MKTSQGIIFHFPRILLNNGQKFTVKIFILKLYDHKILQKPWLRLMIKPKRK